MSLRPIPPGRSAPEILDALKILVEPALRTAIDDLDDPRMRRIAGYQMGWCDAAGNPSRPGGKAIRPALAVLSAAAAGGRLEDGVPAAVAVELVHNFSLLHDDVTDRDVERRHRPTGWVVFGEAQAMLAGTAMLTAAVEVLVGAGRAGTRCLPCLLAAIQQLIAGQSQDIEMERRADVGIDDVLRMESGKTAALLACAASIGAISVGAPGDVVLGLADFGDEIGIAFQLVDDILGVVGDPAATGKSSSSDVRAGKRSAPIVRALRSDSEAGRRLADLFADGPPEDDDAVALATRLIVEAGGVDWAAGAADARAARARRRLDGLMLADRDAANDLATVADYIVSRGRLINASSP
jgi:geranylgeranyl diphosphate synthase, type I